MHIIATQNRLTRGFTLIEVLLAMALTALIGVMAYQGLSSAINALESQETEVSSITNLQTAWRIIGEDLQQATYREITDEEEETKESFIGGGDDKEILMEFTRNGWSNPLGQRRSEIQRVRYILKDRQLWREHWLTLDRLKEPEPIQLLLLRNIDSVKLEFFARKKANREGGEWLDSWPEAFASSSAEPSEISSAENTLDDGDDQTTLPMAVKITLDSDDWGSIDRLYLLPDSDE
jgi:general secretion pathway protein J